MSIPMLKHIYGLLFSVFLDMYLIQCSLRVGTIVFILRLVFLTVACSLEKVLTIPFFFW